MTSGLEPSVSDIRADISRILHRAADDHGLPCREAIEALELLDRLCAWLVD